MKKYQKLLQDRLDYLVRSGQESMADSLLCITLKCDLCVHDKTKQETVRCSEGLYRELNVEVDE